MANEVTSPLTYSLNVLMCVLGRATMMALAQLSYSAFLCHPLVMGYFYFTRTLPVDLLPAAIHSLALFFMLLTFLVSILFYLFIEAPFMNLRVGWMSNGAVVHDEKIRGKVKEASPTKYVHLGTTV